MVIQGLLLRAAHSAADSWGRASSSTIPDPAPGNGPPRWLESFMSATLDTAKGCRPVFKGT